MSKTAITPTRKEDYPGWYQAVVKGAEMAEMSQVRGCMIMRPWGYGIWSNLQKKLNERIEQTGHENVYFPLFIPLSYFEKEAAHVEGFAKEMAVVTHHRLEKKGDKLVPASPLTEPVIVRPTSETIIGEAFSRWIGSYRDLPVLINQWANVVRWEMRSRIFLRTTEFLWQEGHTAHASKDEAMEETLKMLGVYEQFCKEELALPVLVGEKPESERFPGAERTYCIEAMMQDGKALQSGTSHYLGQNFSKAANIQFLDQNGERVFAHTTSWGVSSRLIGALIMTHADDDGLRVPPKIAPKQIVIMPHTGKGDDQANRDYAEKLAAEMREMRFDRERMLSVHVDARDLRSGDKKWQWIKKGVPIIVEIGGREVSDQKVCYVRRDQLEKKNVFVARAEFVTSVKSLLDDIQANLYQQAAVRLKENTRTDVKDFKTFSAIFQSKGGAEEAKEILPFVRAHWCGKQSCQDVPATQWAVTIRCLPFDQLKGGGSCVVCGEKAEVEAVFAKSY